MKKILYTIYKGNKKYTTYDRDKIKLLKENINCYHVSNKGTNISPLFVEIIKNSRKRIEIGNKYIDLIRFIIEKSVDDIIIVTGINRSVGDQVLDEIIKKRKISNAKI